MTVFGHRSGAMQLMPVVTKMCWRAWPRVKVGCKSTRSAGEEGEGLGELGWAGSRGALPTCMRAMLPARRGERDRLRLLLTYLSIYTLNEQ